MLGFGFMFSGGRGVGLRGLGFRVEGVNHFEFRLLANLALPAAPWMKLQERAVLVNVFIWHNEFVDWL